MRNVAIALVIGAFDMPGGVAAAQVTAIVSVPGLDCTAWPLNVRPAVTTLRGVSGMRIDLDRRQVRVDFDDARTAPSEIVDALKRIGLAASVVRTKSAAGAQDDAMRDGLPAIPKP